MHIDKNAAVPALSPAFYGIVGLFCFFLLLVLLRSIETLLRGFRKTTPLTTRPAKPLGQFLEEAAISKISVRVARESYNLLKPHYPNLMCIDLTDLLRGDLHLSVEQIRILEAELLTRCDRRDKPSAAAATELLTAITVRDLLLRIESAATVLAERPSGAHNRATDTPVRLPGSDLRNSNSAQRKAIHAAALQAIESRSLRSPEASGLHRRSSDYDGPRRRATDDRSDTIYKGPQRRTTDHLEDRPGAPSTELNAELKSTAPNGRYPLFVSLNKRTGHQPPRAVVRPTDDAGPRSDRPC